MMSVEEQMLKCTDCGNTGEFITCAVDYITVRVDNNCDYLSTEPTQPSDYMDVSQDPNDIVCAVCGSDSMIYVDKTTQKTLEA